MEKKELKKLISKVSIDIQKDWNMGGLAGGLYEDYAVEIIDRILPTLLDKAREEGYQNCLDDVENNDEFGQYKVWAKYLIEQLSKLKTKE